jgi:HSP20 family protein
MIQILPSTASDTLGILSVIGQREVALQSNDAGSMVRNERSTAQFERSVTLPGPVQVNEVHAKYDNGVLTINLPKTEGSALPVSVTVQ